MIRVAVLALAIYGAYAGYQRVVLGLPACLPTFVPTMTPNGSGVR